MKGYLQSLPVVGGLFQRDLQPAEVWAFWQHMQERFRTKTADKADALEMQLAAEVLQRMGILDRQRFLERYATTVGRTLYVPFEVGVPQSGWDLWAQVVVCVHEHQHVVQHDEEGPSYELGYLTSTSARARYEAEAYTCNLELYFWRYGTVPSVRALAEKLLGYGCRPEDVDVAAHTLGLASVSVRRGAVMSEATQVALEWLNSHVPHLRKGKA
ncbi:hypothetical protein LZ198_37205 [Myxococcus sp. K15C18031901]|uniref:hypothetical protein n=1 Tax=Myxococcus dinghuensis TaxID=2906761 RepID=UPI0020A82E21|nr:hypothetical protein [Myxococcus dinghuensis]MCP3104516.1 hypothetical protein [Myxococcus dinghuensis]